jgi:hypothetical protein
MNKDMTNTEFLAYIMNFSKHGGLMQAFVIEALSRYAMHVREQKDQFMIEMKNSIIKPEAWIGCAEELEQLLEQKYGKAKETVNETSGNLS